MPSRRGPIGQYTDDKGKSHKVILKMDVPRQYSNTAVEVDGSAHGSNTAVPAGVPTLPVVPEPQPTGPVVLVPGKMWWTYPEGSPERAAAQHEASAKAYSLRQQAGSPAVDPNSENRATLIGLECTRQAVAQGTAAFYRDLAAVKRGDFSKLDRCIDAQR